MTGARQVALLVLALSAGPGLAQELGGPAELPPPDFAGQQYVDSKGCLFARAGTPGKVVWVPRVTRDGQRLCGNPPSGRRVPVAEEDGIAAIPEAAPEAAPATGPETPPEPADAAGGGYFVAVGSFAQTGNVTRAADRLQALGYAVVRSRVQGGSTTLTVVLAGPFGTAAEARAAKTALAAEGFPDATVVRP